jgi:hypothetical protein
MLIFEFSEDVETFLLFMKARKTVKGLIREAKESKVQQNHQAAIDLLLKAIEVEEAAARDPILLGKLWHWTAWSCYWLTKFVWMHYF